MHRSKNSAKKKLNVLLIGNNPIGLSLVHEKIKESRMFISESEIVFDPSDVLPKIKSFKPDCIVIDDNMEREDLQAVMQKLKSSESGKKLPITIVQHSNKDDSPRDGADEFILSENMTGESIGRTLLNSLKIHEMRDYLKNSLEKRKNIFRMF